MTPRSSRIPSPSSAGRTTGDSVAGEHPRIAIVIVIVIELLAIGLTGCTSDDAAKPSKPAADLLVVDVEASSLEQQLSFAALQGIVNRDAPTLYLVGLKSAQDFAVDPSAEVWLRDAVDLPTKRVNPDEALQQLLPRTKGLVVWDPAVPAESQDVATTIAGQEDLVPVAPAEAERLSGPGFDAKIQRDLRDLNLDTPAATIDWAINNLRPEGGFAFPVWTGLPRNGNPVQPGLRDWAVMHRAFVFDADPATQPGLLGRVLDLFPPATPVYGYPFFDTEVYRTTGLAVNEAISAAIVAEAGDWLVPSTDAANLSVHAHLGPSTAKPGWDDTPRTPDPDTTYVAFTVSDGDAMGYDETLLRSLQLDRLGPTSVPIGISITPYLATDAPQIYDWIVKNLPDQARLVAGPSGAGYAYPYAMSDLDGYLDHSRELLDRYGLRSTWILEPHLTASPTTELLERFVERTKPSLLLTDYGGNPPEPPSVSFVNGVPVVHTVMIDKGDADIAKIVRSVAAAQAPGPRFVSIGLTTWGANADDAARTMKELGPGYEAVAPDAFAGYLRGAQATGYRGSDEPTLVPTPPEPGVCRATSLDLEGSGDPFARRYLSRTLAGSSIPTGLRIESTSPSAATLTFDTDAIAAFATTTARSLLGLAYGAPAIESADVRVAFLDTAVRDSSATGTNLTSTDDVEVHTKNPTGRVAVTATGVVGPANLGDAEITANLHVSLTFDPGDQQIEVGVRGPMTCAPAKP